MRRSHACAAFRMPSHPGLDRVSLLVIPPQFPYTAFECRSAKRGDRLPDAVSGEGLAMDSFQYQNGALFAEGVDLERIAGKVGTPAYVYLSLIHI